MPLHRRLKWPLNIRHAKCGSRKHLKIWDILIQRDDRIVVFCDCRKCAVSFSVTFKISNLLLEAGRADRITRRGKNPNELPPEKRLKYLLLGAYHIERFHILSGHWDKHFKRYRDGCYAFVKGNRRGPCAPSRLLAYERFIKSGLIAPRSKGA